MRVHCKTCDSMVPAEGVHSCYDAERVTRHREAEVAVIEAAGVMADVIRHPETEGYHKYLLARDGLLNTVAALRELEGKV